MHFEKSFERLLNGLKPYGTLCIVDDFFDENHNKTSDKFAKNWHLNFLISTKHVTVTTNDYTTKVEDLTPFVTKKSIFKIQFSVVLFNLFKRKSAFKKLFLGGLLLDKLYSNNQMKYQLVLISKTK